MSPIQRHGAKTTRSIDINQPDHHHQHRTVVKTALIRASL